MPTYKKVLVTGSSGIIGHACQEELVLQGYETVLTPSHHELELTDEQSVTQYIKHHQPDAVIHCAAIASSADILRARAARVLADNLSMTLNLVKACADQVRKFVFVGSGSVYGSLTQSPFVEADAIQSIQPGSLEGYALSKIVGLELCKQFSNCSDTVFTAVLPTHVYGCHAIERKKEAVIDSLVLALLQARRSDTPEITLDIWGTGKLCKRQYIHVRDCARAILTVLETYNNSTPVNLAVDQAVSLDDVVQYAAKRIQYKGDIHYLTERREVASQRLMDVQRMNCLGFVPLYDLHKGLDQVIEHYEKLLETALKEEK